MPKKAVKKKKSSQASQRPTESGLAVSKQTAGGVTGAVLGGIVGGPVGALAGGAVGAMVGDASAKGKKPVKRAVDAVRTEIKERRTIKALKSLTGGKKSSSTAKASGKSTAKKSATTKKPNAKPAAKTTKAKKATVKAASKAKPTKKRAKKKR